MYGRKYMGIDRTTFLIDREGVVAAPGTRSRCRAMSLRY